MRVSLPESTAVSENSLTYQANEPQCYAMPASRYEEAILREMDGCVQALLSIKSIDPDVVRLQARRAGLETALKRYREINKLTDEDDQ